jgi:putative DNA primase/helicase
MSGEGYDGDSRPPRKPGRPRKERPDPPAGESADGTIRITAGHLPDAVDAAEAALVAGGPGPVFQRAGMLVHVANRPARRSDGSLDEQQAVAAVETGALMELFAKAAVFERFDARLGDWKRIDPPGKLAEAYFARARWRLPDLHQLIGGPCLRADNSLLIRPGYDAATGLYLLSDLPGLSVPDRPSDAQASAANDLLVGIFDSFPFVQDPPGLALSVALAGLIGAVLRPTLPAAPLIGVTAPAAGTGKSYLVDLIAMVATGRPAVGVATGAKPEEFEKSLGSALIEGRPLLLLDNMVQSLAGQLLCMTLSQERVSIRLLGLSKTIEVPTSAALFATANNLQVKGDMARRALLCRLDAAVERPEDRDFDGDLLAEARRRRAELVGAVLTVARWHGRDPAPRAGRRFAGFEAWCARVRDPLLALGHADPVAALDVTRGTDPDSARLAGLIEQWAAAFGEDSKTCAEVIHEAQKTDGWGAFNYPDLMDALSAATKDRPGAVSSPKLAAFLRRFEDKIVGNRRFRTDGKSRKVIKWRLDHVS